MTRPALAFAAVLLLAVTGCSNDDKAGTDPDKKPTSTESTGVISAADLPDVPELARAEGAAADAVVGKCSLDPGRQTVRGTIENLAKRRQDFVIAMNWTNADFDVLGRGVAVVRNLAPGKSAKWKVTGTVVEGATSCVPNIRRGRLKG